MKGINIKNSLSACASLLLACSNLIGAQSDIVVFGDSWANERDRLAKHLVAHFSQTSGLSGAGFCTLVESNGSASHGMAYLQSYSDWEITDQSAGAIGLNMSHVTGMTEGGVLSFWLQSDVDEIEVYYLKQPGGGTFSCYGQDTLLATVDTNSAVTSAGIHVVQWSPTVLPQFFRIKVVAPNLSGVSIGGVNFKTNTDGIRIHKIGNGGLTARQSVHVDEDIWVDSLKTLDPDIFCILLGTNDYLSSVSPTAFKSDIEELVNRIRKATPTVEVMLMSPGDNGVSGKAFEIDDYRDALIQVSLEQDLKFIDFKEVLGDYSTASALGLYSNEIHPNNAGGVLMADAWLSLIIEEDGHVPDVINVLSSDALTNYANICIEDLDGDDLQLSWRRMPGIDYTLSKSFNLESWDEELVPWSSFNGRFILNLPKEDRRFFKLKANYPNVW